MLLQITIKEQYIDKFKEFVNTLPSGAIEITNLSYDDSISFEEAQRKVKNALNNLPLNQGISLNDAFEKVLKS